VEADRPRKTAKISPFKAVEEEKGQIRRRDELGGGKKRLPWLAIYVHKKLIVCGLDERVRGKERH